MRNIIQKQEERRFFKKLWWFIWEDDSVWSWIVNILLAFLIVKFIIYPGLGLLFGTSLPVVAVVSGSMEHDSRFDNFWNEQQGIYMQYPITKEQFEQFRFSNGFNKGDLMVVFRATGLKVGDVIVFQGYAAQPIIHRIVSASNSTYTTKGDHNTGSRTDETGITKERIYGKAVFRLPYLGWFKIVFVWLLGLAGININ